MELIIDCFAGGGGASVGIEMALVKANCGYLRVGDRAPAPVVYFEKTRQMAFA